MNQSFEQKYREELAVLYRLFGSRLSVDTLRRINEIYEYTEDIWNRYVDQIPERQIRYLLVAEAPPWSESGRPQYILDPCSRPRTLMRALRKAFFSGLVCKEQKLDSTLAELADRGFLVVDSIPFAMDYRGKRANRAYKDLVSITCRTYLQDKLNCQKLCWNDDLRIGFAFKLNALEVMKGVDFEFDIDGKTRPLSGELIAVGGANYTDGEQLRRIFGLDSR